MPEFILFTSVKNEGPFILEWVAYHKAAGFTKIYIASNDNDDESDRLLSSLHQAGEITHLENRLLPSESPQGKAVRLLDGLGVVQDGDWVLWLDGDEFFNSRVGEGTVQELVEKIHPAQAILIPWRVFGDSGRSGLPDMMVSEDFHCADTPDGELATVVKTLFRYRKGVIEMGKNGAHRPVLLAPDRFVSGDFITASGRPLDPDSKKNTNWLNGADDMNLARIKPSESASVLAQINHYAVRTKELFELKKKRGRGFRRGRDPSKERVRHNDEYFALHNTNFVSDRSILRMNPKKMDILTRLRSNVDIAAAHEKTKALTASRIASLKSDD